jgi:hypothetical protein
MGAPCSNYLPSDVVVWTFFYYHRHLVLGGLTRLGQCLSFLSLGSLFSVLSAASVVEVLDLVFLDWSLRLPLDSRFGIVRYTYRTSVPRSGSCV